MSGVIDTLGKPSKDIVVTQGDLTGGTPVIEPDYPDKPRDPQSGPKLDMSSQSLLDNATAANDKATSIIDEMGIQKNTSAGASAAIDTTYSWDAQGANKANTQLQMDINTAKQNALANRQTLEQNAVNYQQQADLAKYSANQSAQSAGWTGGYVLDQNRQMEYLKSSIQSQMYGAMELQKYGYDTSLAAARLSYDLNQQEFAHQYYMDAVNVAVTEAQQTGYYISAEVRDMMSQYEVAQQHINSKDPAEKAKAETVSKNVSQWFEAQGIHMSQPAVKTLSLLTSELNAAQTSLQMYMSTYYDQIAMIQAADEEAANKLDTDMNAVLVYDPETGEPKYNPTTGKYEIAYLNTMEPKDVIAYAKTNNETLQRVHGHLNSLLEESLYTYNKKLVDENGKVLASTTSEGVNKYLEAGNKDTIEAILNEAAKDGTLSTYSYSMEIGDATVTFSVDAEGKLKTDIFKASDTTDVTDTTTDTITDTTNLIATGGVNGYNSLTTGNGDDVTIKFNDKDYSLTVTWVPKGPASEVDKKLRELYPNPTPGAVGYYDNRYWVYRQASDTWGQIVEGNSQDKGAEDAEAFIAALKPTIDAQNASK